MAIGVIRKSLEDLVHRREDDVRIYPVPEPADLVVLGKKALPEGLSVLDGRSSLPLAPFSLKRDTRGANIAVKPGGHP
jgi:hypothetical protein